MKEEKITYRTLYLSKTGIIKDGYYVEVKTNGFSSGDVVDLEKFPELEPLCLVTEKDDIKTIKEKDMVIVITKAGHKIFGERTSSKFDIDDGYISVMTFIDETRQVPLHDISIVHIFNGIEA